MGTTPVVIDVTLDTFRRMVAGFVLGTQYFPQSSFDSNKTPCEYDAFGMRLQKLALHYWAKV
jgi:hypothetical protein